MSHLTSSVSHLTSPVSQDTVRLTQKSVSYNSTDAGLLHRQRVVSCSHASICFRTMQQCCGGQSPSATQSGPQSGMTGCCGVVSARSGQRALDSDDAVRESVRDFYGNLVAGRDSHSVPQCPATDKSWPKHIREAAAECHDDVVSK